MTDTDALIAIYRGEAIPADDLARILKTQFAWWKGALDRKDTPLSDDGTARSGFYFGKASRNGGRIPVAIWIGTDGKLRCRVGSKLAARDFEPARVLEQWPFWFPNPTSRQDYMAAYDTGRWPDGTPTTDPTKPATALHGSNASSDPIDQLRTEIDDKLASAERWLQGHPEVTSDTESNYATNLHRELTALLKRADEMRDEAIKPYSDKIKEVDRGFEFRIDAKVKARSLGAALKALYERYMVSKEARARAEAAAAFEARRKAAEAERARVEADRARLLEDDPIAALTSPEPETPELPLAPEPVKVQSGGGVGRAAGLKSEWVGDIEDYRACLDYFAGHEAIKIALEKIVRAAVKVGKGSTTIPGVRVTEKRRVA